MFEIALLSLSFGKKSVKDSHAFCGDRGMVTTKHIIAFLILKSLDTHVFNTNCCHHVILSGVGFHFVPLFHNVIKTTGGLTGSANY